MVGNEIELQDTGYLDRRLRVIRIKGIGREFARGRN